MNKKLLFVFVFMILLGIGTVVGKSIEAFNNNGGDTHYIPKLRVVGDVNKVVEINSTDGFPLTTIQETGKKLEGISLVHILKVCEPITPQYDLLLVGLDGLFARLDGGQLKACYIHFSEKSGWTSLMQHHPINSRIKELKEIVVVAKDNSLDEGINIINCEENLSNITPGKLYFENFTVLPYYDGKSSKEVEGKAYDVKLYRMRKVLPIKKLIPPNNGKPSVLMGEEGDYEYIDGEGYLELKDNKINYIDLSKRKQIQKVKGIIVNPPNNSIMNTYYDTLHYLENNENVLIIYIDGLGYHQYKYGTANSFMPFISTKNEAKMALSVYKPVTNSGFAAMITGQPPKINGIHDRKAKDLRVPSLFGEALKMEKRGVLIEGSIKIMNTEIEPLLHVDKNKNNSTDDEVLETALKKITEHPHLLMVHFHSVDDLGHKYGDLAPETMDKLKEIDGYVKALVENWEGKVIITSDHGMHKTNKEGGHGSFRYEDLIVPYIMLEGGK
ncbi:alkaline phosphatase family protein [Clostridiaceae bacterium 35-E11]